MKEMKQLIISLLLIVTVSMHTRFSEADPQTATVWDYCGQTGQYTNGSAFQRNLNKVLESLVDKVYSSGGGYNASLIQGNGSAVYGLMQCRGDLDSSNCKQCALAAKTKLVQDCHNTSGFIQLDGCFLHYDNHLFYNDTQSGDDPTENIFCSNGNSSQPEQFTNAAKALLSNITSKAEQSSEFFAAGSVAGPSSMDRHIYSIGQCWRDDLSPRTSCGACLAFAFSNIFESCQIGALAAQFGSRYCYLRYEIYGFFNTSILAPGESRLSPPVSERKMSKRVLGMILGIVAATFGLIAAIGLWKWKIFHRLKGDHIPLYKGKKAELVILSTVANPKLIFEYDILREATSNFKAENKLGEGGFGTLFRGTLPDGREVAVKRLCIGSMQGDAEFLNEANLISQIQHRNLVKLLGCSVESSERLLVYEYLQNSSLDKILFDATKCHLLQWKERYEIIVGTARGLAYLHEDSEIRIIHRDIKVSNLLLDNKLRPKIADFGLARLFSEDLSHVSTRVAGTL